MSPKLWGYHPPASYAYGACFVRASSHFFHEFRQVQYNLSNFMGKFTELSLSILRFRQVLACLC